MTTDSPARPGLVVADWRPLLKNTLRGFATVTLPNGLTISEIAVHVKDQRSWASFPGKPLTGRDGTPLLDPGTGKQRYSVLLSWPDRPTANRFSGAVIDAVEAKHPGAVLR